MRAKALVDTMAETLQEAKAKTPLDTLNHLKAKILMDTLAGTGPTRWLKQYQMQRPGHQDTLGDMNSATLMHRLAETLAEDEHELLGDTWKYVQADTHENTPHDNLVEAKV